MSSLPLESNIIKEARKKIAKLSNNSIRNCEQYWLIGRRITYGYTLNSGIGSRDQYVNFKYEGQLLEKSKSQSIPVTSKEIGNLTKNKRKQKFAASNLVFECSNGSKVLFLFSIISFYNF